MPVALWTSTSFLDQVTDWVTDRAEEVGLRLTGERDQPHARPWSSAIRFGTGARPLWFKVNGPGTVHEGGLLSVLSTVVPDLVPRLVAVDTERGWTLMHDAGPVLRSVAEPAQLWDRWAAVLREYGAAQLDLRHHVHDLIAAGVEDLSPEQLPARLAGLVDELAGHPVDRGGLSTEEAKRLRAVEDDYRAWCAELAGSGIGATINHDDLHSSNVCVGPDGTRIIDWGDASVMHPFGTMLATLNSVAWHAGAELDDPRVEGLRDAYLDVFAEHGSHEDRVRWVRLARTTGCVSKAVSYVRAFEGEPDGSQAEEDWPVRGWLLELLEEPGE